MFFSSICSKNFQDLIEKWRIISFQIYLLISRFTLTIGVILFGKTFSCFFSINKPAFSAAFKNIHIQLYIDQNIRALHHMQSLSFFLNA